MLGRATPGSVCEWLRHFIANSAFRVTPLNWVLCILAMIEQPIVIQFEGGSIPCSLYKADSPIGIALLGHGLGVDRYDETVLALTQTLNEFGFSVLVPELPLHGDRSDSQLEWPDIVTQWQEFFANDGRDQLLAEWQYLLDYTRLTFGLPIVYFGLSLGTQYGILFLAQTLDVKASVLGLFGSEPPPKSIIMNHCAPLVTVPVYFIQKLNDEMHSAEKTLHLYETLGSSVKILDSSHGLHQTVTHESVRNACSFLVEQIDA